MRILNGNVTIEIKYDNIYISGKYINAQNGNDIDIFDYTTRQKIKYDNVVGINQTSNEKYSIAIMQNEKFRIIDNSSKELKEQEYDYLEYAYDNYFITFKNGKFGMVDLNGNKIIDFKYDLIQKIPNANIVQAINNTKNSIDLIAKDKIIISMSKSQIKIMQNYIIIESDNDRKYIDFDGNVIDSKDVLGNALYATKKGSKWGFTNKNGENIVEAKYDFVTEFNEYGFAGIKKDGKWGSINKSGEIVIEPKYEIESNNPNFVGKYYENNVMYGESYYVSK